LASALQHGWRRLAHGDFCCAATKGDSLRSDAVRRTRMAAFSVLQSAPNGQVTLSQRGKECAARRVFVLIPAAPMFPHAGRRGGVKDGSRGVSWIWDRKLTSRLARA